VQKNALLGCHAVGSRFTRHAWGLAFDVGKRQSLASDSLWQVEYGHTYKKSIALIRDRLNFLTVEDKEWMLRKTAEQVFFT